MVGYDFDKTIYKGDSTVDFFFYMIFTRPYLLLFTPWFLAVFALYGIRVLNKKRFKELVFFFVPWYSNIEGIVNKFWSHNANKIQDWYTRIRKDDDVIISASLSFVIRPALDMLNIKYYITTNYSIKTGKIIGDNCYGSVKQVEFTRIYPNKKLDAFYSDSLSDMSMFEISEKAYLVTGGEPHEIDIKEYKNSLKQ